MRSGRRCDFAADKGQGVSVVLSRGENDAATGSGSGNSEESRRWRFEQRWRGP